ncbi:step II splicing factor slu7, putative [Eimeria acervulina]|uniref:Pre-mRNA-splicing factor SLU7 n=1 Tax=Eimeria acervulina TaxID=5801 RepID=U6GFV2_EIMAC|nr:step II splicing factor slu7, putative [Eimeria acervulina]CDI78173.1 step II splicing factor slu7, putative [Eimeria acervulina]
MSFQSREEVRRQKQLEEARKAGTAEAERDEEAAYTNKSLAADEIIAAEPKLTYDAKRDRYGGYTGDDFMLQIKEYEAAQLERKKQKQREQQHLLQQQEPAAAERRQLKQQRRLRRQKRRAEKLLKQQKKEEKQAAKKAAAEAAAAAAAAAEAQAAGDDPEAAAAAAEAASAAAKAAAAAEAAEDEEESDEEERDSDTDSDTDTDTDSDGSNEEEDKGYSGIKLKEFDKTSAPVECTDERSRINTRDLRIREDTAKYLLNLDLNSAFYDPKSRSMREDPFKHLSQQIKPTFRGDNALLQAGEVKATQQLQLFAWEAYKHGQNVHFNAQPTQLEFLYKEHQKKKAQIETEKQKNIFDTYGGKEHLVADTRVLYAQTEAYVEYSKDGRILRGRQRTLTKSKYEEDVLQGSHTSVWGSYYDVATSKWGYACCRLTSFAAECTGRLEDNITMESLGLTSSEAAAAPAAAAGAAAKGGASAAAAAPAAADHAAEARDAAEE